MGRTGFLHQAWGPGVSARIGDGYLAPAFPKIALSTLSSMSAGQ